MVQHTWTNPDYNFLLCTLLYSIKANEQIQIEVLTSIEFFAHKPMYTTSTCIKDQHLSFPRVCGQGSRSNYINHCLSIKIYMLKLIRIRLYKSFLEARFITQYLILKIGSSQLIKSQNDFSLGIC